MKSLLFKTNRKKAKIWKRFGGQSLTIKLVGVVSAVVCLVIGAGTLMVMDVTRRGIAETSITTVLYQTQRLRSDLIELMISGGPSVGDLTMLLEDVQKTAAVNQAKIFDRNGYVIASTDSNEVGKWIPYPPQKPDRQTADGTFITFVGSGRSSQLKIVHSITQKSSGTLIGGIELLIPLAPIFQRFGIHNGFFVSLAVILIILIACLIRWLVHRIVKRPLKKLIHVMERAERGELDVRTSIREDPELRRVAKSFNTMVRGIQAAQKRLEIQHQKELAQSNRLASLGQYMSNVSHEIKNPLTAISSALHILKDEFQPMDNQEIFQELGFQLERIERTVNNLLRYARQAPPNFEKCNVLNLIQNTIKVANRRFQENGICTKINCSTNHLFLYADEGQLEQVFLNLFLNAADAMKNGGLLKIDLLPGFGAGESNPNHSNCTGVKIIIRDTGTGINHQNLGRIFEPFFTTKRNGTGLGLSVVKGIVEAHEGSIHIESHADAGTDVYLYFPFSGSIRNGRETISVDAHSLLPDLKGVVL